MKKTADRFHAVIGLVIAALILFTNWLKYQGISYSIFKFYATVNEAGGIMDFSRQTELVANTTGSFAPNTSIVPAYLFLALPILVAILLVIRSVLFFIGKDAQMLSLISYGISFVYILTLPLCSYDPCVSLIITIFLFLGDYMGGRFIIERDEMHRKARELKRQEALALADKKRRMRFPGTYSKDFFEVIFANFRSNFRSYLLFIIASASSISLIYMMAGASAVIATLNPNNDLPATLRMQEIITSVTPIILILTITLLVLIISNYIKTRMKNYSIFLSLGIRKKTLWLIIALEYLVCILVSCLLGLLFGNIFFPIFKALYLRSIDMHTAVSMPYGLVTLITCGVYLLITDFATLINYHLFEHVDISSAIVRSAKPDKLPRRLLIPGLLIGIYYVVVPVYRFVTGRWGEETALQIDILIGSFFVLYCGGAKLLKRFTKNRAFLSNHLFAILPWRYRFKTNAKYWLLLFALNLFALSIFLPRLSSCLIAEPEKNQFPYDFVCLTQELDDTFMQDLEGNYDVQMNTYEMVRINTVLGVPYSMNQAFHTTPDGMVFPQGIHIGISESTYGKLKAVLEPKDKTRLSLEGDEIHTVRLHDTSGQARPLDWFQNTKTPRLKAGVTGFYTVSTLDQVYPPHPVKSQEKQSLIGMFPGITEQNLVVFSDTHFSQLYQAVEKEQKAAVSPTRLVTLLTDKETYPDVSKEIESYKAKHETYPYANPEVLTSYEKETFISTSSGERFFKEIAYFAVVCILLICSLFIYYLKYSLEVEELKQRNKLLVSIGMSPNDLIYLMKKEMRVHSYWTFFAGAGISAIFFLAIPALRLFHTKETLAYLLVLFILMAVYTLIYCIGMRRLEKNFIKETCG